MPNRTTASGVLICLILGASWSLALAEFHGYDFNHNGAPGHQQPGYEYMDKYVRFDDAVPGSFGWRRSGITSNTHASVAGGGPPGLYELYYDSNNSWDAGTFSTNLGNGNYLVTLYWGRIVVGGDSFSFSVTFEDTDSIVLQCGDGNACEYTRGVDVTDGTLDITFDHVDGAWWMISGIGIELVSTDAPESIRSTQSTLRGSSPNPFREGTRIEFELEKPGRVHLDVFDVAGHGVATLVDGEMAGGHHRIHWSGRSSGGDLLPGGIYFYRLETDGHREIGKMVLVK